MITSLNTVLPPSLTASAPALEPADRSAELSDRVAQMVHQARLAADWWQAQPVRERCRWLRRYRRLLVDAVEELLPIAGRETYKPRFDLYNEVMQSCLHIEYFCQVAPRLLRPQGVTPFVLWHKSAALHYRPLGVVGLITPWNYPIVLVLGPMIQALLAGNAIILKPSEQTPATARFLVQLFDRLAWPAPAPVVQLLPGGPESALALAHAEVDKIAFTGGSKGGKAILQAAAERLTPVLLELGGNDAFLVDRDADLERAARAAVWGKFLNAGQSCLSVERCYVHREVANAFVDRVVYWTQQLQVAVTTYPAPVDLVESKNGPIPETDADMGPLITASQFERACELLQDAIERGATVLWGGLPEPSAGELPHRPANRIFPPTILADLNPQARVLHEEIFAPILCVQIVTDMEEAVRLTNASPLGLAASVWTKSKHRGEQLAAQLQVGGVTINDALIHFAICNLPFGGMKKSGHGRINGPAGLYEFCNLQAVVRHRFGPQAEFQWFPYGKKYRWIRTGLRWLFGTWFPKRTPTI